MLRDLTPTDEPALAAFFTQNNLPDIVRNFHPFQLDAASACRICTMPRRDCYFVFVEDHSILGLGMLRGWDDGYAIPSFGVLVHHAHHGRGIGKSLTEHALCVAKEMSAPRIRLTVHRENFRAVQLYERTGFRVTEQLADGRLVMFADV